MRRRTSYVPERLDLFERWAKNYDDSVEGSEGFPFTGYAEVLARAVTLAAPTPDMRVLDLGTGTGNLAERFAQVDAKVWGLDFSEEMLAKARVKVPNATFLQADLLNDWSRLPEFERIVSAYVLHEFDIETKLEILRKSTQHLMNGGSIVLADIAFPNEEVFEQAHERWQEVWDEGEYYWIADEALTACEEVGLEGRYEQVSSCAGIFIFRPTWTRPLPLGLSPRPNPGAATSRPPCAGPLSSS